MIDKSVDMSNNKFTGKPINMEFVPEWTDQLAGQINDFVTKSNDSERSYIWERSPKLVIFHTNDDRPARLYLRNKMHYAERLGVDVEFKTPEDAKELEQDMMWYLTPVDGRPVQMMLQQPADSKMINTFTAILDRYQPDLDVEGVTWAHQMALRNAAMNGHLSEDLILPCTVAGDLKLMHYYLPNYDYDGKVALVIGRSDITGTPAANVFEALNCTVIKANSHTKNLNQLCQMADIIVSCAGHADLVTDCKPGAVLIDNGISYVHGKYHGDISDQCYSKALAYTPYLNATGRTTVHCLYENLLKNQRKFFND